MSGAQGRHEIIQDIITDGKPNRDVMSAIRMAKRDGRLRAGLLTNSLIWMLNFIELNSKGADEPLFNEKTANWLNARFKELLKKLGVEVYKEDEKIHVGSIAGVAHKKEDSVGDKNLANEVAQELLNHIDDALFNIKRNLQKTGQHVQLANTPAIVAALKARAGRQTEAGDKATDAGQNLGDSDSKELSNLKSEIEAGVNEVPAAAAAAAAAASAASASADVKAGVKGGGKSLFGAFASAAASAASGVRRPSVTGAAKSVSGGLGREFEDIARRAREAAASVTGAGRTAAGSISKDVQTDTDADNVREKSTDKVGDQKDEATTQANLHAAKINEAMINRSVERIKPVVEGTGKVQEGRETDPSKRHTLQRGAYLQHLEEEETRKVTPPPPPRRTLDQPTTGRVPPPPPPPRPGAEKPVPPPVPSRGPKKS
jgi:hypothetical protein